MNLSPNDDERFCREPEKTSWVHFSSPLRYGIFIIILIGVLVGLWYLISPTREPYYKVDIALIRADQTPYKIKEAHQGVPSVKHQDKLVYGRIRADENEPVAEHILPDPETPALEIKDSHAPIKMIEQYSPEDMDPDKIVESPEEEPPGSVLPVASIEDLIEENSEDKSASEKKSAEENLEPEKKRAKGKTLIQLGSLKSYDLAESEWKRLSKKHSDVLGGLEPAIQKVDLGEEQGIYYRLRTGPFDGPEKANQVCRGLKEQKSECVVIQ